MNAITYAINNIRFNIPIEVLRLSFGEPEGVFSGAVGLDELITTRVIRPKILVDCNLVGGVSRQILVSQCKVRRIPGGWVITVPKELTDGRSIINVTDLLSGVTRPPGTPHRGGLPPTSNPLVAVPDMLNPPMVIPTTRLELLADNIVLVKTDVQIINNGVLNCNIENDNNLNNISPRSYTPFAKLVLLGVKAYIHNTLTIRLGEGYIYNGHELGIIKETIDNYADAHEMYQDFLENTWSKIAYMNDKNKMSNYIASITPI